MTDSAHFTKQITSLTTNISELRVCVKDIDDDPDRVVELFETAERSLRMCQTRLPKLTDQEQKKYNPILASHRQYLGNIRPTVEKHSRNTLLGGGGGGGGSAWGAPQDDEGKSLEQLQSETEASAQRSLQLSREARQMGESTLTTLATQREQLEKTQQETQRIDQMLNQSDYLLRGIKSIGGAFSNVFRKVPTVDPAMSARSVPAERTSSTPSTSSNPTTSSARTPASSAKGGVGGSSRKAGDVSVGGGSGQAWGGEQEQAQVQADKTDMYLSELSTNLGYLKQLGNAMGDEIDSQGVLIDKLGNDVDALNGRIEKNNKDMKKILKK